MSQYYPPPSPFHPPEQSSEDEYYDEVGYEYEVEEDDDYPGTGDSLAQRSLIFCSGGCLVFLCLSCCALLGIALWWLDPGSSLVATPVPGSDIGLSFDEPAYSDESVVNEQMMQLTILEINRNAALPAIPLVEGRELIVVTIELVNQGEEDVNFDERDFLLLNQIEEAYASTPGAIEGALGRGQLPVDTGLEGRLVFEMPANEYELILTWEGGSDSQPRYILLE